MRNIGSFQQKLSTQIFISINFLFSASIDASFLLSFQQEFNYLIDLIHFGIKVAGCILITHTLDKFETQDEANDHRPAQPSRSRNRNVDPETLAPGNENGQQKKTKST